MSKLLLTWAVLCNRPQEDWRQGFIYLTMVQHSFKQCGMPAGGEMLAEAGKARSSDPSVVCIAELCKKLNFNLIVLNLISDSH